MCGDGLVGAEPPGCALDELAELLCLPPLALRSQVDAVRAELEIWRGKARDALRQVALLKRDLHPTQGTGVLN